MSEIDELPEGWTSASTLDFADLLRGVSYSKGEATYQPADGLIALLRANNISDELAFDDLQHVPETRVSQEQLLQPGDVVLAMSSGSKSVVGKAAQFKCQRTATFGAFCGVLRPSKEINPAYFGYFFKTKAYRNAISEASAGTNINNLKREYFGEIEIPLSPLAEQKRIVGKVETLLARVNAARQRLAKVPALLKRFRQSVLAAACSGRLTEEWRVKSFAQANGGSTAGDLPDSWQFRKTEEVCSDIVDCPHSTPKWTESGEVCLRTTNFRPGYLDLGEVRHVSKQTYQERIARLEPRQGDVVYSREGGILGIACIIPKDLKTCLGQRMMLLRSSDRILPVFLMNVLNSPSTLDIVRDMTGGSASPHLNVGDVKQFDVPLPPLAEQHEIVRRVEALLARADRIEKRLVAATRRVETLTQAILAQAFRGELVPTEAELARREGRGYEPASALLERIRVATAETDTGRRGGKKTR